MKTKNAGTRANRKSRECQKARPEGSFQMAFKAVSMEPKIRLAVQINPKRPKSPTSFLLVCRLFRKLIMDSSETETGKSWAASSVVFRYTLSELNRKPATEARTKSTGTIDKSE